MIKINNNNNNNKSGRIERKYTEKKAAVNG